MDADLRISRIPPADEVEPAGVPALDSFLSEAGLLPPPARLETENPLWEFPEEGRIPSRQPSAVRQPIHAPLAPRQIYVPLSAAVFVAVIAGAWWEGAIPSLPSLPTSRQAATNATAQAAVVAPAPEPPVEVPAQSPAELMSSLTLPPSARAPVARLASTVPRAEVDRIESAPPKPVALSAAVIEQRRAQERADSARGTSGGALARSIPRAETRPPIEPLAAAPMVAASPAVRTPAPEPPPVVEAPRVTPAAPSSVPATRPEPEALPSVGARTEQSEIQRALGQYRSAYHLLNAEAARAVWPSVDVRALARAFDTLHSQELAFDTCLFEIAGEAATAQCRGSASYTPKIGNRAARLEQMQWTFRLRKSDEGWKIQSAQARR